jgi:hypothetical protein
MEMLSEISTIAKILGILVSPVNKLWLAFKKRKLNLFEKDLLRAAAANNGKVFRFTNLGQYHAALISAGTFDSSKFNGENSMRAFDDALNSLLKREYLTSCSVNQFALTEPGRKRAARIKSK